MITKRNRIEGQYGTGFCFAVAGKKFGNFKK